MEVKRVHLKDMKLNPNRSTYRISNRSTYRTSPYKDKYKTKDKSSRAQSVRWILGSINANAL